MAEIINNNLQSVIMLNSDEFMVNFTILKRSQYHHWKNEYSIHDIPISDKNDTYVWSIGDHEQIFQVIFDEQYILSAESNEIAIKIYMIMKNIFNRYLMYDYMKWSFKAISYDKNGNHCEIDIRLKEKVEYIKNAIFKINEATAYALIEY